MKPDKSVPGKIPERVRYVKAPTIEIRPGSTHDRAPPIVVCPVFPVEDGNPKTLVTAQRWAYDAHFRAEAHAASLEKQADGSTKLWDELHKRRSSGEFEPAIEEVVVENIPMSNIRIVSLEHRSQGGRAYKALIDNYYYVDIREDDVLESILSTGIDKGGVLNGKFQWMAHSGLRLVRDGSEKQRAILNYSRMKSMSPLKVLTPGRFYQDKNGKISFYVGPITTKTEGVIGDSLLFYSLAMYSMLPEKLFAGELRTTKDMPWETEKDWKPDASMYDYSTNSYLMSNFEVTTKHKLVEEVGSGLEGYDADTEIRKIQELGMHRMAIAVKSLNNSNYYHKRGVDCYRNPPAVLNMVPRGQTVVNSFSRDAWNNLERK